MSQGCPRHPSRDLDCQPCHHAALERMEALGSAMEAALVAAVEEFTLESNLGCPVVKQMKKAVVAWRSREED